MGDSMDQRYWDQRSLDRRNSMDEQDQAEARRQAALNDPANQAKVRVNGAIIEMVIVPSQIKKTVLGQVVAEVFIGASAATLIFRKEEGVWEPKYPDKVKI